MTLPKGSVQPHSGRADITIGYPVCSGGFGTSWHEPVNMACTKAERIGQSDRQNEEWRCPRCQQTFRCDAQVRVVI